MNEVAEQADQAVDAVERADIAAVEEVGQPRDHPAAKIANAISMVADQPELIGITAAVTAWGLLSRDPHLARGGARMLAAMLLATGMKSVVKNLVSRTRPHLLLEQGVYDSGTDGPDDGSWQSFPSGHTAGGVAVARALARHWPDAAVPAYAAATFIGLLQLPRGAHYPSDIVAGAVVGVAAEALSEFGIRALERAVAAEGSA